MHISGCMNAQVRVNLKINLYHPGTFLIAVLLSRTRYDLSGEDNLIKPGECFGRCYNRALQRGSVFQSRSLQAAPAPHSD